MRQNLVFCTLFNTLHAEDDDDEGDTGLSRFRFFGYVCGGAFLWYFLPGNSFTDGRRDARSHSDPVTGFLFQALSVFSFVCWAAPSELSSPAPLYAPLTRGPQKTRS